MDRNDVKKIVCYDCNTCNEKMILYLSIPASENMYVKLFRLAKLSETRLFVVDSVHTRV